MLFINMTKGVILRVALRPGGPLEGTYKTKPGPQSESTYRGTGSEMVSMPSSIILLTVSLPLFQM